MKSVLQNLLITPMAKETLLCPEMKRFGHLQEEKVNSENNKKKKKTT